MLYCQSNTRTITLVEVPLGQWAKEGWIDRLNIFEYSLKYNSLLFIKESIYGKSGIEQCCCLLDGSAIHLWRFIKLMNLQCTMPQPLATVKLQLLFFRRPPLPSCRPAFFPTTHLAALFVARFSPRQPPLRYSVSVLPQRIPASF